MPLTKSWMFKLWILISLLVWNVFTIPNAIADDTSTDTSVDASTQSDGTISNSILTQIDTDIQKIESDLATFISSFNSSSTVPPGNSNNVASNVGTSISSITSNLEETMDNKEITDLVWGLYGTIASDPTSSTAGTQVGDPYNYFITNYAAKYCAPSSLVETSFGAQCQLGSSTNTIADQYAELKLSSLLGPSKYSSTTDAQVLAESVITTLTSPFPDPNFLYLLENGLIKASDKAYFAKVMAKHAAFSAARNSLNEMYSLRLLPSNGTESIMSVMESESSRRFKNNDNWYSNVESASIGTLVKELVEMEAYKLWTDYYRYRQSERIEALLAIMVSQGAEQAIQIIKSTKNAPQN